MEIKQLKLYSKDINEQLHFYHHVLALQLIRADENKVELQAGSTKLVFEHSRSEFLYHYCFLIPNGKLEEAMSFLEEKEIGLLPYKGSDIINFPTGRSIYFYDPDGNIAEFIERPSLRIESDETFSADSILKLNEIGMPHDNPLELSRQLIEKYKIQLSEPEILRSDFCWVGDYHGVLIVPEIGRNWIPTNLPAIMNDFEIEFESNEKTYKLNVVNNEIV